MTSKTHFNFSHNALPPHMLTRVAKLALPVAIQSALVAILALADVLMVSDLGPAAPAAVGVASKWHFVIIMISAGMSSANGILVAQYWGKGDSSSAKTVANLALKYGSVILLPVSIIVTVMSSYIMMLQTSDMTVIELGSTYLWYGMPVLLLTHWIIVGESSLRSSGDAMLPLMLGATTVFLNIGLNYWFIGGGFGVPALGVAGAALGTTIARFIQVVLLYMVLRHRKHWTLTATPLKDARALAKSFRNVAIPTTNSALLWAFGTLTYQMIFGHMGTTELAVFSMIGPFESLCYSLFFGISVACSVLIGQSLGRDEFNQAVYMTKFFIKMVVLFCGLIAISLYLGKSHVLAWLSLDSPELMPMASPALSILSILLAIRMVNMIIINGILRAGGDNAFCLRMDFYSMWCVGIPLAAYGAFIGQWGFEWVYGLMLAEEAVKFALCFNRYLKRTWVNNLTLATA